MVTFLNRSVKVKDGRGIAKPPSCLRILVLTGLGTMVLTGLCLLSGCGSDRTPEGSVKGKNAKTANLGAKKSAGAITLLTEKEGMDPARMGQIKPQPESRRIEVFGGMTKEEMEAKVAAEQKNVVSMDLEVMPGITKKEIEARIAADQKRFEKGTEIFRGITREELKAKIAADREAFSSKPQEIFPGITLAELKARQAAERKPDPKLMMQTFPGVNQK